MPRGPRITIENACYHVMTRGNQKQNIFKEKGDYDTYLRILKKYKSKYKFSLYGYCLMPNHVHLIMEPRRQKDLSKIMQGLNLSYAIWFNKNYDKVGHLHQDRFKSMVVYKDKYILNCINYIEANPVRAQIIEYPGDYKWSSYKDRVFNKNSAVLDFIKL